jgi:hypothetical protein
MPEPASFSRRSCALWTAFVLFSGFLVFCGIVFALGWLAGRWTVPAEVGDHVRLEPGETWSQHINRIVSTSQGLRDQEYDAIVKAIEEYKERRPEYTHVIDDSVRMLREDHEARAKPIPHPEMKVE